MSEQDKNTQQETAGDKPERKRRSKKRPEDLPPKPDSASEKKPDASGEPKEPAPRKKRYQGYDVDEIVGEKESRRRPWFWKVLLISLLITAIAVALICAYLLRSEKQKTDYLSKINDANTMSNLLSDHKLVKVVQSYSHLAEGSDYTTTRYVKTTKKGEYYSYYKIEGTEADYKEVIKNRVMYRYDEQFVNYYALVGTYYEDTLVPQIEGCLFQTVDSETIKEQTESSEMIRIQTTYEVQDGDRYVKNFDFSVGETITRTFTIDAESMVVMSASESCGDEEFYTYRLELDGEEKVPQFYKDLQKIETTRECTVYDDYEGENEQKYTFDVPTDVYFTVPSTEDATVYMDKNCTQEFTEFQLQLQNPESEVTLYRKKN